MNWNQKALLSWNEGKANEAISTLFKAIEQQPNDPDGYYNLIQLFIAGKKFADAKGVLDLAQEKFPGKDQFVYAKGNWHYQQQQYKEALKEYEDVFHHRDSPLAGEATAMMGQSYLALRQPKQALVYLLEAEAQFPEDRAIWMMIGDALLQTQSFSDAGRYFNKVITADDSHAEAWFKKGLTKRALNHNSDEVKECFKKSKEANEEMYLAFVSQLKDVDDGLKKELK